MDSTTFNVLFAEETEESLYEAITFLLDNPDYRNHLEKGASEYWQNYGTPEASLKLLGINLLAELKKSVL